MSISDFLFEGRPPPSVTTYGQTVENMPKWLSDYTQGLIARANAVASEGYQPYGGPRIAGFSPEEEAAFQGTTDMQGAWRPALSSAADTLEGGLSQARDYLGQGAGTSRTYPGAVQEYMDPYVENVIDRNTELSTRAFDEQFLPSLQGAFTRAGHFGSDRMMDLASRGTRDAMGELHSQNRAALSDAYRTGADIFGQDEARLASDRDRAIQAAGVEGELGLRGAGEMGALAQTAQRMGLTDLAALQTSGQAQRGMDQASLDLAYQDFARQRDYPRETIDWMSSVIRGMPYNRAINTTEHGPADIYQPSGASQLGSLLTAGAGIYDVIRGDKPQAARGGRIRGPLSREYAHVS